MAKRIEFPKRIKMLAALRCEGRCEQCGDKLMPGRAEYDHITPCGLGGTAELDNCKVLCPDCHYLKTHKRKDGDRAKMRKADRLSAKQDVKPTSKYPMAGSRSSKWKKKLDGTVVKR